MGKSHQLLTGPSEAADHNVKHDFQLVFTDLMGPITPETRGCYKYVSKIFDEHTKRTETYLLTSEGVALSAFQSFVQLVLCSGVRVKRLQVYKGGKYMVKAFKDYGIQTGVSLEYASTHTPQKNWHVRTRQKTYCVYGRKNARTAEVSLRRVDVYSRVSGQ